MSVETIETYEQIVVEQIDAVLRITLNRPERMNAWTPRDDRADGGRGGGQRDRSIGAIVFTGAGRGFCAGADIEAVFESGIERQHQEVTEPEQRPSDWVRLRASRSR